MVNKKKKVKVVKKEGVIDQIDKLLSPRTKGRKEVIKVINDSLQKNQQVIAKQGNMIQELAIDISVAQKLSEDWAKKVFDIETEVNDKKGALTDKISRIAQLKMKIFELEEEATTADSTIGVLGILTIIFFIGTLANFIW